MYMVLKGNVHTMIDNRDGIYVDINMYSDITIMIHIKVDNIINCSITMFLQILIVLALRISTSGPVAGGGNTVGFDRAGVLAF